jgi:hypothetical protein
VVVVVVVASQTEAFRSVLTSGIAYGRSNAVSVTIIIGMVGV